MCAHHNFDSSSNLLSITHPQVEGGEDSIYVCRAAVNMLNRQRWTRRSSLQTYGHGANKSAT
jgi:hypothetical protein